MLPDSIWQRREALELPRAGLLAGAKRFTSGFERLQPALGVSLLYQALASTVRIVLFLTFGLKAGVSWSQLPGIVVAGALNDTVVALYWLLPLHIGLALLPERLHRSRLVKALTFGWMTLAVFLALYGAAVAFFFFDEFDSRLNLVAVDYLIYPHEVLINIWDSYPVAPVVGTSVLLAVGLTAWLWRRWAPGVGAVPLRRRASVLGLHLCVVLLFALFFSTRTFAHFDNRVANEIEINGLSSFFEALWTNRLDYHAYYRTGDLEQLVALLSHDLERGGTEAKVDGEKIVRAFPAHAEGGNRPSRLVLTEDGKTDPVNVVIVVEESLGADFLGAYGSDQELSPEFDALAEKGLLARHAYATGTRTVRGLEAIVTSFPPIPSVSIVRRPGSDHIANLGATLRQRGYRTSFLYGGFAYFDNMAAFFEGNDYEVSDRSDIAEPTFANIWGVSDQDLFRHAIATFDRYTAEDSRPFFTVVLSTSNHKPFTFPAGIPGIPPEGGGRLAGVRYADYALGEFFRSAAEHRWFNDTLFVVVGDHGARVYGAADIPLKSYEIPILFMAPGRLEPREIETLASQIDIAPTILGLLGERFEAPFYGQDLLALDSGDPSRSLLFNHNHDVGLLRGRSMVVLGLHGKVSGFDWDPAARTLEPAAADRELADLATAYYQVAYDQFRDGLYR